MVVIKKLNITISDEAGEKLIYYKKKSGFNNDSAVDKILRELVLVVFLFLVCSLSGRGLVANVSSLNLSGYLGDYAYSSWSVRNDLNFSVYDVKIESSRSELVFNNITVLGVNDSGVLNVSLFCSNLSSNVSVSRISFKYVSDVEYYPVTYSVVFNESGFFPPELSLIEGDVVNFSCSDSWENHTISEMNISLEQVVNCSVPFLWTASIGNFSFFDRATLWIFNVNVSEPNVSRVHDSAYDLEVPTSFVCSYNPSNVSLEVFISNFTLLPNATGRGVLRVVNPSVFWAYDVRVGGDWLSVDNSSFDLAPSDFVLSFFNVTARVNLTNQTNKSYNLPLCVSGLNFERVCSNVSLFVPFFNFSNVSVNGSGGVQFIYIFDESQIEPYCRSFPSRCPVTNVTQERLVERTIFTNITESSLNEALVDVASLDDKMTRVENKQTLLTEDTKKDIEDIKASIDSRLASTEFSMSNLSASIGLLAESLSNQSRSAERKNSVLDSSLTNLGLAMLVLLFFGVLISSLAYFHYQKSIGRMRMMQR